MPKLPGNSLWPGIWVTPHEHAACPKGNADLRCTFGMQKVDGCHHSASRTCVPHTSITFADSRIVQLFFPCTRMSSAPVKSPLGGSRMLTFEMLRAAGKGSPNMSFICVICVSVRRDDASFADGWGSQRSRQYLCCTKVTQALQVAPSH